MYLNVLEWKMYWKKYWKTPLFGPVLELYWRKIEKTAICTWMYLNLGILYTWVCLNFKAPMPLNRQPFHLLFKNFSPCGRPFPIISVFQVIIFMFKLLFAKTECIRINISDLLGAWVRTWVTVFVGNLWTDFPEILHKIRKNKIKFCTWPDFW